MKLMKETKRLNKEQAEKYLKFNENYEPYDCCKDLHCFDDECIFQEKHSCITEEIKAHATKHNITPEQSYAKWRGILKEIVEGEK